MVKTFPIPLTKEEMKALIDSSMEDEFFYMLFNVAKTTGRRLGEYYGIFDRTTKVWVGGVQVKDLNLEKGVMETNILKRKKYIKKEAVLIPEVVQLLKVYIRKNNLKLEDYVFRKLSYRQIQNRTKSYAQKAGITKNVSFHNFRHYFITELVRLGWSYEKIRKLTGHSSLGTLVHYDHATSNDVRDDAVEAVSQI